ncbi:hypothetical protein QUC32_16315 [Novosphingobium resinovorum]|jgi:hypothetical protein|uniref:Uncharacterized protein n=1 Tax=Novosphingobium resinovorum TaxID=158500 RepID=A0A031K6P0_9SPHN|nr:MULTISPECIES: hypothetical protein [Novosphingobium]AOR75864.1 hypothetical protein BES08_03185 [Novosphingobium resinovorum]EZP84864.1 hypothetical protein BV97_00626 [Novosphingobium resinovorum]MBF7011230.1 hypothetical protein [Novosphingobium sp. HR1a]WJM29214.1 hypothetical protein QUC32_16315 [Novosphingobium resinovorum]
MIDQAAHPADTQAVEAALRRDLVRGDAAAASALPVLRYLVAAEQNAALSEEILARVKGILADIAGQLLDALIGSADRRAHAPEEIAVLTRAFLDEPVLLAHIHAAALEWQLTERLQERIGLDPVASPLIRERAGCGDALARGFLAAQANWSQGQRRMALPLAELPDAVLEAVLAILRALVGAEPALSERASAVEAEARRHHAAHANRLQWAERLVADLDTETALSISHAGVALFLTALSLRSGEPRDVAATATQPGQQARLALSLLAAQLPSGLAEEQVLAIHAGANLPNGLSGIDAWRAASILSNGATSR